MFEFLAVLKLLGGNCNSDNDVIDDKNSICEIMPPKQFKFGLLDTGESNETPKDKVSISRDKGEEFGSQANGGMSQHFDEQAGGLKAKLKNERVLLLSKIKTSLFNEIETSSSHDEHAVINEKTEEVVKSKKLCLAELKEAFYDDSRKPDAKEVLNNRNGRFNEGMVRNSKHLAVKNEPGPTIDRDWVGDKEQKFTNEVEKIEDQSEGTACYGSSVPERDRRGSGQNTRATLGLSETRCQACNGVINNDVDGAESCCGDSLECHAPSSSQADVADLSDISADEETIEVVKDQHGNVIQLAGSPAVGGGLRRRNVAASSRHVQSGRNDWIDDTGGNVVEEERGCGFSGGSSECNGWIQHNSHVNVNDRSGLYRRESYSSVQFRLDYEVNINDIMIVVVNVFRVFLWLSLGVIIANYTD